MYRYHLSCPLVYLSTFSFPFRRRSQVSYKGSSLGVYPFHGIFAEGLSFKKLPRSSEIIFCIFCFIAACLMVSTSNIPSFKLVLRWSSTYMFIYEYNRQRHSYSHVRRNKLYDIQFFFTSHKTKHKWVDIEIYSNKKRTKKKEITEEHYNIVDKPSSKFCS